MSFQPEIMAPVSNMEMLKAAIHNGANAVYVGMPGFNARGRSDTISILDLGEMIQIAHLYGVRIYVAFNILVFEEELNEALDLFCRVNDLGPDAFIVQDIGLAQMIRKIAPQVRLHASTQTTIVNSSDIEFFKTIFHRFTLSRELSLNEIKSIRDATSAELEVFIHGSLCIAYSGQCFTSSGFGGRSANRGECAQSCRHEYDLVIDGKTVNTEGHFLVSPRDLCGIDELEALTKMGIEAIKIEGRLKPPEYVAATVQLYKKGNLPPLKISGRLVFNRLSGHGWLKGLDYGNLVNPEINSHTGLQVGKVEKCENKIIKIKHIEKVELKKGDGVLIRDSKNSIGGFIYNSKNSGNEKFSFSEISMSNDFPFHKIRPGMDVYLTSSPETDRLLRKTWTDRQLLKRIPVEITLQGKIGEKLVLEISDGKRKVRRESQDFLQKAVKSRLNREFIETEIRALSATSFEASRLEVSIDDNVFLPNQVLKSIRQEATEELSRLRKKSGVFGDAENPDDSKARQSRIQFTLESSKQNIFHQLPSLVPDIKEKFPALHLLIRDPFQLDQIIENCKILEGINTLYLDFQYGRQYEKSIEMIRERSVKTGIATARIYKQGEEKSLVRLAELQPDLILVRNATALNILSKNKNSGNTGLIGDFSLNITNHASAEFFLNKGLSRLTTSFDLVWDNGNEQNPEGIIRLCKNLPGEYLEVPLYYFLPSFYMDYCLYSKHLAQGRPASTCGQPCEQHRIALKDRKGKYHPVIADRNCRNEMFNGEEKNIENYFDRLIQSGIRNFRIELKPEGKLTEKDLNRILKIMGVIEMNTFEMNKWENQGRQAGRDAKK